MVEQRFATLNGYAEERLQSAAVQLCVAEARESRRPWQESRGQRPQSAAIQLRVAEARESRRPWQESRGQRLQSAARQPRVAEARESRRPWQESVLETLREANQTDMSWEERAMVRTSVANARAMAAMAMGKSAHCHPMTERGSKAANPEIHHGLSIGQEKQSDSPRPTWASGVSLTLNECFECLA
jgi:hypothetical protein